MADELLRRLRTHVGPHDRDTVCVPCKAADEIERLRADGDALAQAIDLVCVMGQQIECLLNAGDALAAIVRDMPHPVGHLHWLAWRGQVDNALMGWEEARR